MLTYIIIGVLVLLGIYIFFRSPVNVGFKNVSIDELSNYQKDKNTVLLDVRTKREIRQGMIGKPLEIELGLNMQQKLSTLNKDKKYIVYCRSGQRSVTASNMMVKMGFTDVNNLLGGYLAWQRRN